MYNFNLDVWTSLLDVVSRKITYSVVDQGDHRLFCTSFQFWQRKIWKIAKNRIFSPRCRPDSPSSTIGYCRPDCLETLCTKSLSSKPVTWPEYVICENLFFDFSFVSGRQMRPNLTVLPVPTNFCGPTLPDKTIKWNFKFFDRKH